MVNDDEPMDPFENLVLDEDFVRGGRFEPPARTRESIGRGLSLARGGGESHSRRQRRKRSRSVVMTALVLAGVSGAIFWTQQSWSGTASSDRLPGTFGVVAQPTPSASIDTVQLNGDVRDGACYTWNEIADESTPTEVPCASPHLSQIVSHVTLNGYGNEAPYPTRDEWRSIVVKVCTSPGEKFLGAPLDTAGQFAFSSITPLPRGWAEGARVIECDIIDNRPRPAELDTGPHAPRLAEFTGDAHEAKQAFAIQAGTCEAELSSDGDSNAVVVPCAGPHWIEFIGSFELLPDQSHPTDAAFAQATHPRCTALATTYAGHEVAESSTVFVSARTISAASWDRGNRMVNCAIWHVTKNGDPGPVNGSEKSAPGIGRDV